MFNLPIENWFKKVTSPFDDKERMLSEFGHEKDQEKEKEREN